MEYGIDRLLRTALLWSTSSKLLCDSSSYRELRGNNMSKSITTLLSFYIVRTYMHWICE